MNKSVDFSNVSFSSSIIFLGVCSKKGHYNLVDKNTGVVREGDYDNVYINVACPYEINSSFQFNLGFDVHTFKIPTVAAAHCFGVETFNPSDFADWLFKPVNLTFDRHGNVSSIKLL